LSVSEDSDDNGQPPGEHRSKHSTEWSNSTKNTRQNILRTRQVERLWFLPRGAIHGADCADRQASQDVCLSLRLSLSGIVSKCLYILSKFFHHLIFSLSSFLVFCELAHVLKFQLGWDLKYTWGIKSLSHYTATHTAECY